MKPFHYSRNGSRIPNPYVDNAEPGPGHTYATINGHHVRVITMSVGVRGWAAYPEGFTNLIGYGYGPSHAVGELDRKISK
jgi:hypothetical protein